MRAAKSHFTLICIYVYSLHAIWINIYRYTFNNYIKLRISKQTSSSTSMPKIISQLAAYIYYLNIFFKCTFEVGFEPRSSYIFVIVVKAIVT